MSLQSARPIEDRHARNRVLAGAVMIVCTSVSIQLSAALASTEFDRLGPAGVSSMRFALGAAILLVIVRPAYRGRTATTWRAITAYGGSLAALNLTFFGAISLIPLGIAVSLSFIGPLTMAFATSRRCRDIGFALLAVAGVATLGGIDRPHSIIGVILAILAGCAWTAVAYTGRSVGRHTRNVDGLALALPVAALITLPFGATILGQVDTPVVATMLVIAIGGLIVPFALELEGLRRLEPSTVAIIYSIDPAIAAVVGLLALNQHLSTPQVVGLAAVIIASMGAATSATMATIESQTKAE